MPFPRGSEAGTFLHDLLEWAATQGFAAVAADPVRLRDTVARRCQVRGWDRMDRARSRTGCSRLIDQPLRAAGHGRRCRPPRSASPT